MNRVMERLFLELSEHVEPGTHTRAELRLAEMLRAGINVMPYLGSAQNAWRDSALELLKKLGLDS